MSNLALLSESRRSVAEYGKTPTARSGIEVRHASRGRVDAQPRAVRRARSAISGTPSLRRSKKGSSVVPARRRLYEPSRKIAVFHRASVVYQRMSDIERPERSS